MKCLLLGILTILGLLTLNSNVSACGRRCGGGGCCFSSCSPCVTSCPTPCYSTPVAIVPYQVPFAYPVLVPAFQFQYVPPTYVATAYPSVVATAYPGYAGAYAASPVAFGTQASYGYPGYAPPQQQYAGQQPYMGQGQYGSQQQYQGGQQQQNNNSVRDLARAILEELSRQAGQQQGNGQQGGGQQQPQDQGPPSVPGYQPPQGGQSQNNNQQQNLEQVQKVALSALSRTCAYCHTGVGAKNDIQIFSQPGLVNQNAPWDKVLKMVKEKRMPPKDSQFRLNPQESSAIIQWLEGSGVTSN